MHIWAHCGCVWVNCGFMGEGKTHIYRKVVSSTFTLWDTCMTFLWAWPLWTAR